MVKQVSAGCSAREGPAFQSSKQIILHLLGPGTEGAPGPTEGGEETASIARRVDSKQSTKHYPTPELKARQEVNCWGPR